MPTYLEDRPGLQVLDVLPENLLLPSEGRLAVSAFFWPLGVDHADVLLDVVKRGQHEGVGAGRERGGEKGKRERWG